MPTDGTMYPGLYYDDAPAAIAFLERAFGFETLLNVPGENGIVAHAELRLGEGIVMSHPAAIRRLRPEGGGHPVATSTCASRT